MREIGSGIPALGMKVGGPYSILVEETGMNSPRVLITTHFLKPGSEIDSYLRDAGMEPCSSGATPRRRWSPPSRGWTASSAAAIP